MKSDGPIVFIVCTGVGHINRGYESFTIECFNELKTSQQFDMFLLKGGGRSGNREIVVSCVKRHSRLAKLIYKITGKEKYWIEQCSFFFGMLPYIIRYNPSVIYYSDFILGTLLWHFRRFFKFKYKLLFSNGAPNGPPFKTEDHVHQLISCYEKQAIDAGTPAEKQTLLPYGFDIGDRPVILQGEEKKLLRGSLGLPNDRKIIISVGAINSNHKRMDYVVKEFSCLDSKEYYLVLLGHIDENSPPILNIASKLLQPNSYVIVEVPKPDVSKYLLVSDYFILASLNEGFGRVMIEAQQYGLIPIVHDNIVAREVLKLNAVYGDLTENKMLKDLICRVDTLNLSKQDLWEYAFNNYSWKNLRDQYIQLIKKNLT